jgi:4-hydroxy-tetrahydrodipicolinate reductase
VAATEGSLSGSVRVAVAGYRGKVGVEVVRGIEAADDLQYVGGIARGDDLPRFLAEEKPQVVVDFTHPSVAPANALAYVVAGAAPVIGTSGWTNKTLEELENGCRKAGLGGVVAPNFAIGAVVMMWLAEKAAPFFDAVEVIEAHHAMKADAPSATAHSTARRLAAASSFARSATERLTLEGVRGGEAGGVGIHSLRLPGVVADQEIIFGLLGQTLTIAHRTTSREAFVPGVLLAVRKVVSEPRFYRGLDSLLGLS